jgi:hypothetical protein
MAVALDVSVVSTKTGAGVSVRLRADISRAAMAAGRVALLGRELALVEDTKASPTWRRRRSSTKL